MKDIDFNYLNVLAVGASLMMSYKWLSEGSYAVPIILSFILLAVCLWAIGNYIFDIIPWLKSNIRSAVICRLTCFVFSYLLSLFLAFFICAFLFSVLKPGYKNRYARWLNHRLRL